MGEAKSTAELTVEDIQYQLNDEEKSLLFSKNQPPRFISRGQTFRVVIGDTLVLPCEVENLGKNIFYFFLFELSL